MVRRPYIVNPRIIKSEFIPDGSASRPDGYTSGAPNKEVIGMDGRCDWFRAECRECRHKLITRRSEKSTRYYACPECGAWHHQNKGFFDTDRFETKPLKNDEVDGTLHRMKLKYSPSDYSDPEWYYGLKDDLQEKRDRENYEVVSDIEPV